ncbi:uncharacterized protein LOC131057409 isoform X1 [Cryptomeria japonica]|uniref:uncharacterized protein LOC131057409 isoform X1 n=1 Tax=Cryptomeria japonica TaxID=3369 RepID=UPI0027DA75F7|nr:uncharacterized protein LOC131057409 isoform X1 [Cryptomeria japonica]
MLGRRYNTVTLFKSIVQRYARIQIALDRVPFSSAALADVEEDHFNLEVKDEYPKPDPKFAEIIRALPRAKTKRHAAVQLRKAGRIPSIIFECENGQQGGNKRLISVETKQIRNLLRKMGESFFRSRIYDIEVRSASDSEVIVEKGRVLPRLEKKLVLGFFIYPVPVQCSLFEYMVDINRATDEIVNVTFIRAPSDAMLKVDIPLLYRGEDACTGIRKGGYLNTIKRTVKYLCPTDLVPPYIDVDLSELDVGQKILMRDLKVHPFLKLIQQDENAPVCKIMGSRYKAQR